MEFSRTSGGCTRGISCMVDIIRQCPDVLKAPSGCNNPCTVFKINQYCCNSGNCSLTDYSRFFKTRCFDAYNYPKDDQTSTFTNLNEAGRAEGCWGKARLGCPTRLKDGSDDN